MFSTAQLNVRILVVDRQININSTNAIKLFKYA